ncbi:hypothetical protein [Tautonia marina]|uniref:hypothetical protein n=1 Tax=Tautonia marina TaxID=2653855 RepID=UPI001260561D|nr:hypothetical protein [Tautonia marina]
MNCPKCGTTLVVPEPMAGGAPPGSGGSAPKDSSGPTSVSPDANLEEHQSSSGFFDAVELSSDELRNLFPEETGETQEEPERDQDDPAAGQAGFDPEPGRRVTEPGRVEAVEAPANEAIGLKIQEPSPSLGPQVLTESPDPGGPNGAMMRPRVSRDVVIPRLAVLSWSLFVLIALFLAFVAGLLVGHFVWDRPG